MPYDSSGNFSLVPGTIVSEGMTVQPSQHNPPFQDVAAGMGQVLLRSGVAPMTGVLNMNGNKIGGLADATEPGDAISLAYIQNLAVSIGDGAWSVRDLGSDWLRRNGKLYLRSLYPELADLMPTLPDGMIWTSRNLGSTNALLAITQNGGTYVGAGVSGLIAVSTDRQNWTLRDSTVASATLRGGGFGAGIYLFTGSGGIVVKSPDASAWGSQTVISGGILNGGCFDGTNFIVVGGLTGNPRIAYSADGNSWSTVTPAGTGVYQNVGSDGSRAIAVGAGGSIVVSDDHGATWTTKASGVSDALYGVVWDDTNSLWIVCGANGRILTSTDGNGWTSRSSGTSQKLNDVDASETGIIIGGDNGVVVISTNGTSYSLLVTGFSAAINAVLADQANPSIYLAGGSGGALFEGVRTLPTQFRVPNDDPTYGWIRAK